jgi:hypothetical protein
MKIIRYRIAGDITIEFQDEHKYTTNTTYSNFKTGQIKNPYDKSIWGVGYLGEETETHFVNNACIPSFGAWTNMIERCYAENLRYKHQAYEKCTMCKEWHNYQNFRKWYDDNYYNVGEGRMHIDKDVLIKDNKVYSHQTCIFLPQRINMLFIKKNRTTDSDLPTGIRRTKEGFSSTYNGKWIGNYKILEEALYHYNIYKQIHINKVAEEYKGKIPDYIYYALLNWNKKLVA